jgi:hypothetical protein
MKISILIALLFQKSQSTVYNTVNIVRKIVRALQKAFPSSAVPLIKLKFIIKKVYEIECI